MGVDAVGVGDRELGEGLLPVGHDLSFDEAALGLALLALLAAVPFPVAGSFVLDGADRQPQQLDCRVVAGEVAAVLGDLPELVVQRLDGVGGVNDAAQLGRERQERGEPLPRGAPGRDRVGVLLAPVRVRERVQLGGVRWSV